MIQSNAFQGRATRKRSHRNVFRQVWSVSGEGHSTVPPRQPVPVMEICFSLVYGYCSLSCLWAPLRRVWHPPPGTLMLTTLTILGFEELLLFCSQWWYQ